MGKSERAHEAQVNSGKAMEQETEDFMRRSAIFATILGFAAFGNSQGSQATGGPKPPAVAHANDWMRVPTPVSSPDPVPPGIRLQRDQIFDSCCGYSRPLVPEGGDGWIGEEATVGPEIPDHPRRTIVIGKFTKARSVLTASQRAVYSELTIHVTHIFQDYTGHLAPDTDITVLLQGGTVQTESGQVIRYMVQPQRYSLKPNGTYLLILGYSPDGDFYTELTNWDLSDGTVRANREIEAARERRGESTLIGLSQEQAVRLLDKKFVR